MGGRLQTALYVPGPVPAGQRWPTEPPRAQHRNRDAPAPSCIRKVAKPMKRFANFGLLSPKTPQITNLLYEGGALAMQQRDPDLAMPLLLQCERLAPDFAHLQRYLGLAFMMSGDPLSARPHYQRETELYPWMLSGLAGAVLERPCVRETAELHDVSERLRELYAYRGKFWWPDRKKSLELWAVALNSGDAKAAAQAMRDWPPLHQKARPERFADPALGRLLSDLRPSTELAHGGFHEIDAEWWLALLARARNIRSTDTTNDLHQLLAQCTVTEQDTRAPDQMVNGAGPAESCAVFAIWMLADAPPLLVAGDGWLGWLREDHMLVIEHGGAGWDVRPESAEFAPEFPREFIAAAAVIFSAQPAAVYDSESSRPDSIPNAVCGGTRARKGLAGDGAILAVRAPIRGRLSAAFRGVVDEMSMRVLGVARLGPQPMMRRSKLRGANAG